MSLSNPPYPTAQITYTRDMKFGMESQWGNTFGAIRGFFQFRPLSRNIGVEWGSPWGLKNHKKFFFEIFQPSGATPPHPHISAQGRKLKKPSDDPKSIPPLTFHTKFHVSTISGLGCRVGWVRKWHIAFYNPSEPVILKRFKALIFLWIEKECSENLPKLNDSTFFQSNASLLFLFCPLRKSGNLYRATRNFQFSSTFEPWKQHHFSRRNMAKRAESDRVDWADIPCSFKDAVPWLFSVEALSCCLSTLARFTSP